MGKDNLLYALTEDDFQNVSQDILERNLTNEELELVADKFADKIDWFDIIASSINELNLE